MAKQESHKLQSQVRFLVPQPISPPIGERHLPAAPCRLGLIVDPPYGLQLGSGVTLGETSYKHNIMTKEQITDNVQRRIASLNKLLSEKEITEFEYVEMAYHMLDYWMSVIRDRKKIFG